MTLKIKLSDLVAKVYKDFFFDNTAKHILLTGGRSSAKGDTTYTKVCYKLSQNTSAAMVYVPIQDTIVDGCFKQVQTVLNRMNISYEAKETKKRIVLTNGSEIIFKGMAMENSKKSKESFKGTTSDKPIAFVVFDELANSEDSSKLEIVQQTFARTPAQFIYIFNPPTDRTSWLYDLKEDFETLEKKDNKKYKTFHTTVYDLKETNWPSILSSIEEAERLKSISLKKWEHAYMGLPVGEQSVAFPLLETSIVKDVPNNFQNFYVFTDNGNVDATVFTLIGLSFTNQLYVLRTYYNSGRENKKYMSDSEYASELKKFLLSSGIKKEPDGRIYTPIFTDSKNFEVECINNQNLPNTMKVTNKNRSLSYIFLKEFLISNKILIWEQEENNILIEQLHNSQLELKYVNGQEKYMVKRPNNNNVSEKRQIHCVDTLLYASYMLASQLLK